MKRKITLFVYFFDFFTQFDKFCEKNMIKSIKRMKKSLNYQRQNKNRKFGDEMDISKIVFNYKNKIKKHISNL